MLEEEYQPASHQKIIDFRADNKGLISQKKLELHTGYDAIAILKILQEMHEKRSMQPSQFSSFVLGISLGYGFKNGVVNSPVSIQERQIFEKAVASAAQHVLRPFNLRGDHVWSLNLDVKEGHADALNRLIDPIEPKSSAYNYQLSPAKTLSHDSSNRYENSKTIINRSGESKDSIFNKKFGKSQKTLNEIFPNDSSLVISDPYWDIKKLTGIKEILGMAEPEDFEVASEYLGMLYGQKIPPRAIILSKLWVLGRVLGRSFRGNDLENKTSPMHFWGLFLSLTNPKFQDLEFQLTDISKLSHQEIQSLLELLKIADEGDLKILVNLLNYYRYQSHTGSLAFFRALTVPNLKPIMAENTKIIDAFNKKNSPLIQYLPKLEEVWQKDSYKKFIEKCNQPANKNNFESIQQAILQVIQIFKADITANIKAEKIVEILKRQGCNIDITSGNNKDFTDVCNNILKEVGDFYPVLRGIRKRCHAQDTKLTIKEIKTSFELYGQGSIIAKAQNLNDILQMTNGTYNIFAILDGFRTSGKTAREEWTENFSGLFEVKAFNALTTGAYNQDYRYLTSRQLLGALGNLFQVKEIPEYALTMGLINGDRVMGKFSCTEDNDTRNFYNQLPLHQYGIILQKTKEKGIDPFLIQPLLDINSLDKISKLVETLPAQNPELLLLINEAQGAEEIANILEQFHAINRLKISPTTWQSLYRNLMVTSNRDDPKQTTAARERVRQMTNALASYQGNAQFLETHRDLISTLPIEQRVLFIYQPTLSQVLIHPFDIALLLDPPAKQAVDKDAVVLLRKAGFSQPYASLLSFDFNTKNPNQINFLDKITTRINTVNEVRKISQIKPVSDIEKGELLYLLTLLTGKTYGGGGGATHQQRFNEFNKVLDTNFTSIDKLKEDMENIILKYTDNESIMMQDRQLSQEACKFVLNKSPKNNVGESLKNLSNMLKADGSPVFLGALRALESIHERNIPLGGQLSIDGSTLSSHIYFLINAKLKGQDQTNAQATLARALYDMLYNPEDLNSNSIRCNIGALERLSRVLQGYTIDNQKCPMVDDNGNIMEYIDTLKQNLQRILFEENIQEILMKYPECMQGFSDLTSLSLHKQHIKDYSIKEGRAAATIAFLKQTQHLVSSSTKSQKDPFTSPLARLAYAELLQKVIDEVAKKWDELLKINQGDLDEISQ